MHVALYSPSRLPVRGYGGTQRVIGWLARGLAQLGHRITLIAPAGSALREANLVELDPEDVPGPGLDLTAYVPAGADILHAHAPLLNPPRHPCIFTLHGNRPTGQTVSPNVICLSAFHARRHGTSAFVYNGADPADFQYRNRKADFDLFLGRLHRAKGYRWAIEGAKRAGKRLIVAGGWRPTLRRSLRFVGSVDGHRKAELLADAQCLWMPALWDEPFGLTLIEAMLSGTPVLGTRRGALPEIISLDSGRLGDTLQELIQLRVIVDTLDPSACRARAERSFSHLSMAREYLRMYQHYLETGGLPPGRMIAEADSA